MGTKLEKLCLHHILKTLSNVNVHTLDTHIALHIATSKHDAAKFKKCIQYINLSFISKKRINNILGKPNFTFLYIYRHTNMPENNRIMKKDNIENM